MTPATLVILPGLDGTGDLLERFVGRLPSGLPHRVLSYPTREPLDYGGLERHLLPRLPAGRLVLLGESFGGPLAVRLAARVGPRLAGLVLVASFVRHPVPVPVPVARRFVPLLARFPPPAFAARHFLLGPHAPDALVAEVRQAISSVAPAALSTRAEAALSADVRAELRTCAAPLLYLQGRHDRLVPARAFRDVRAARRDVELEVLSAPHLVLQAVPAAAARRVVEFFEHCNFLPAGAEAP